MKKKTYMEARSWLKEYKLFEKELESRMEYLEDFRKILIDPLKGDEHSLRRIFTSVIAHMEREARKLRERMDQIERVINKLDGEERSVIYHRYIKGVSWLDMPDYLMYEQRTCQTFEMNALKKIIRMKIDWEGKEIEGQKN